MTTPVGSTPGPSLLTATGRTYVVRSGDTLSAIASREGIALADLLRANPQIVDPNRIQVGQLLKLPDPRPPALPRPKDPPRGPDVFETKPAAPPKTPEPPQSATTTTAAPPSTAGSGFFSKLTSLWDRLFPGPAAPPTSAATPAPAAGGVKLSLGPNEKYREAILLGSQRTSLEPAALASLINAEAGRVQGAALTRMTDEAFHARHPELGGRSLTEADTELVKEWKKIRAELAGTWDPAAGNRDGASTALGLTQFIEGTWIEMARRRGSYLNEVARKKAYLDDESEVASGTRADLLALRTDATLSIVVVAEYGKSNLEELRRRGLVSEKLTDDERARLMYLAHHEGVEGAEKILRGTLTDREARRLLNRNVSDEKKRAALVEEHGGEAAAYKAWLNAYIQANIRPERFR